MKLRLLTLPLIMLAMPSAAQDLRAGWDAAMAGDHETALLNWTPLAESGDAQAQYQLGLMYRMGTAPLEQSNEAALDWFRLAAKQGFAPAQSMLGVMYFAGAGTPQDYETAHMWSNIAAGNTWKSDFVAADVLANLQQNSRESRDSVERLMTPEAIERAQARARRCVASKYAECD